MPTGPGDPRTTRRWRTIRAAILANHPPCAIALPGRCTGIADTVDAIIPHAEGGSHYDPANLRPACSACNTYLGASLGGKRTAARRRAKERHGNPTSRDW